MVTDRTAFPTTQYPILISGNNVQSFKTGAAITAGQVVSIVGADGVTMTVIPCVAEAGCCPVGVAIENAATSSVVPVAMIGCIARVSNAYSDTDIDCGHLVTMDDCAIGGTVVEVAGGTTTEEVVGALVEDSTAASLGLEAILVLCGTTLETHGA
jgi:hypothetical protein